MKHILHNSEFQLDEILFKERNKEYGAYPLRRDANLILTKSVFLGVGLVAILSISPLLINAFRTKDIVKPIIEGKHRLWNIPQQETETPRKEEKKQNALEKPKEIDTRLPEPKLNATNEHRSPKLQKPIRQFQEFKLQRETSQPYRRDHRCIVRQPSHQNHQ